MQGGSTDGEQQLPSLFVRDLRLPEFHPREPVLFVPAARAVVSAFSDIVVSGIAPPVPYVVPARNRTYWYLGPVGLLVATGQSGRRLTAAALAKETSIDDMKVIAAKAALLRPIHWLAEARAWQILNHPSVRDASTGFQRYVATKRRRITELLRALSKLDILRLPPPPLEHRVVSEVGPIIAALDPDFSVSLLREAERHQRPVRQVLGLCQSWQPSAVAHWERRIALGLSRLTSDEAERLQAAGIRAEELPTRSVDAVSVPYPVGSAGLVRVLLGSVTPANVGRPELRLIA